MTQLLFLLFACFATGLAVYCVMARVHKQAVALAVHAAVHEVKKEAHDRHLTVAAQLAGKEAELQKLRDRLKLHEEVPSLPPPKLDLSAAPSTTTKTSPKAKTKKEKGEREGLDFFEMSRPFTDTSYDALVATSDVEKIEPAAPKG